jgi:hypothetical protein
VHAEQFNAPAQPLQLTTVQCNGPKVNEPVRHQSAVPKLPLSEVKSGNPAVPMAETHMARWVYPNNKPVRGYQLSITETGLFDNTLVCLPTGLGKTLIAAVIMCNFYRCVSSLCVSSLWFSRMSAARLFGSTDRQHTASSFFSSLSGKFETEFSQHVAPIIHPYSWVLDAVSCLLGENLPPGEHV